MNLHEDETCACFLTNICISRRELMQKNVWIVLCTVLYDHCMYCINIVTIVLVLCTFYISVILLLVGYSKKWVDAYFLCGST